MNKVCKLAEILVGRSTAVRKGEHVLIDAFDAPDAIVIALIEAIRKRRAYPHVQINRTRISRELLLSAEEAQLMTQASYEAARMERMDAYIGLRGAENIFEQGDVYHDRLKLSARLLKPVLDRRINNTKWVVLRWPSPSMAQQAGMSTSAFEDHFFRACTFDHSMLEAGAGILGNLMARTDQVQIRGPGTDLRFSIKGIGAKVLIGSHNIPDGEVFSAPVPNTIEGEISYNVPSVYWGSCFDNIRFKFKKGRIVEATGNHVGRLNEILDSDRGARCIGEFALGFHPHIMDRIRDILFDEKIAGSFHLTPGWAYSEAGNGNHSQIHWDLVSIQRPEYGGGEVWFDKKLVRKDGLFVPKELQKLNPETLLRQAERRKRECLGDVSR